MANSSKKPVSARQRARQDYQWQMRQMAAQQRREQQWSERMAQRQMDFQERMSSTAHQREMADLQAAGLNPVLAAGSGGASTPAGSEPSYASSIVDAMPQLFAVMQEQARATRAAAHSAGSARVIVNNNDEEKKRMDSKYNLKDNSPYTSIAEERNREYFKETQQYTNHYKPNGHSKNRAVVKNELERLKVLGKDYQQKIGEVRANLGMSMRGGARVGISEQIKAIGHAAEALYRLGQEAKQAPGNIMINQAKRLWKAIDRPRYNSSWATRNFRRQLDHEAEVARDLLGY